MKFSVVLENMYPYKISLVFRKPMSTCLNSRVDHWQQNETNSEQDVNMSENKNLGFRDKQQWRGLDPNRRDQD